MRVGSGMLGPVTIVTRDPELSNPAVTIRAFSKLEDVDVAKTMARVLLARTVNVSVKERVLGHISQELSSTPCRGDSGIVAEAELLLLSLRDMSRHHRYCSPWESIVGVHVSSITRRTQ
jgi:hypothetical protein